MGRSSNLGGAKAQPKGSRADYRRAASLPALTRSKVFSDRVIPHWLDANRFWYCLKLPGQHDQEEAWLVDAPSGNKSLYTTALQDDASSAHTLQLFLPDASLRSGDGETETEILFVNRMDVPVRLLWLDWEGRQKEYAIVPSGGSHRQHTFASHAWLVTTSEGKPMGAVVATETPGRVVIDPSSENSTLQLFLPDAGLRSGDGDTQTEILFVNRMDVPVRLLWLDGEGRQKEYAIVPSGGSHRQHTYASHAWLVTTSEGKPMGAVVATQTPGRVVISGVVPVQEPEEEDSPSSSSWVCSAADWHSPDGKWKALIRRWNVYLRPADQDDGRGSQEVALTMDGNETDSYGDDKVFWSPDSKKLVAFQTTNVREREISIVESSPTEPLIHPKLHTISYPKPGDPLPQRRPRLFDATTGTQILISQEDEGLFSNSWSIDKLRWEPDSSRFTFLYNQRGHQVLRIIAIDAKTGRAQVIVEERSLTFIDYANKQFIHFLDRTGELIWMSERDGWNHLYLYDAKAGAVKNQITSGKWVVRGVDRVDEKERQVWFHAGGIYPEQDPYYIHYCRINLDGSGLVRLTEGDGTHSLEFSPGRRYFIDTYSRVDLPPVVELRQVQDGSLVTELERGDASELVAMGWRAPQRFVAKARDLDTDIYGVIFHPMNFDPSGRYPVIEAIYAGPQGSFVPKKFSAHHDAQTLAELGFIVVQIDGMGTSNRSKAFHDVCAKNLGDAGLPDRILWMQAAAHHYPYMDLDRVGIYGVSAGGQSSLRALLMYPEFYKVGVSACGCHDNRMDKMWWNELWMGWPLAPHYHEQSNVTQAYRLQGKLLLIVSEMDTNVDPASTLQVVNALVKADKDFDLVVIPGVEHGMGGAYGERRMQDFFVRHLLGVEPREE